ncbi:MAG TPA: hypothetical protein VEU51_12040 [Candidatus Acidoferrales bacterium]|nr:hypothetical protein [Candidatus Acidoferrales bacterium]
MKNSISRSTLLMALVVAVLVAAIPFAVVEFFKTGELYVLSRRFADDMVARFHGPGRLRFILQPTVATVLGVRDGVKDARAGNPPFLWDLVLGMGHRSGLLRSALASVRDLVAVAILLDVASQLIIFRMVHPGAAYLLRLGRRQLLMFQRGVAFWGQSGDRIADQGSHASHDLNAIARSFADEEEKLEASEEDRQGLGVPRTSRKPPREVQ